MIARLEHPTTGEVREIAVDGLSQGAVDRLADESRLDGQTVKERIATIPLAIEARQLLLDLAPLCLDMDGRSIPLGRMALEFIHDTYRAENDLGPGRAVGAALETLLAELPVFSWLLSLALHPIMLFLGLPIGFSRNLDTKKQNMLRQRLRESFSGLEHISLPNVSFGT